MLISDEYNTIICLFVTIKLLKAHTIWIAQGGIWLLDHDHYICVIVLVDVAIHCGVPCFVTMCRQICGKYSLFMSQVSRDFFLNFVEA